MQEDIEGRETDSAAGDDEENASGDEDLSEEHRSFQLQNQLNLVPHFSSLFSNLFPSVFVYVYCEPFLLSFGVGWIFLDITVF